MVEHQYLLNFLFHIKVKNRQLKVFPNVHALPGPDVTRGPLHLKVNCNAKFMLFNMFAIHAMHKTTIFIIQLCVVLELFSLKDACSFIAETASFYVTVESGVSMRKVNIW